MKSTYKLLGVFWDRKEIVETNFDVIRKCRDILDYRYVRELFDVNNYVRKIKVSELLKANLENDVKVIINQLRHCDKIVGVIDYFPRVKNAVLRRFVRKRILQVLNYLRKELPNAKICVSRKVW